MEETVTAELSEKGVMLWKDLARWGVQEKEVKAAAEQHCSSHPELVEKWEEVSLPRTPSFAERRFMVKERQWKREAEAHKRERIETFMTVRQQVATGSDVEWLIRIAHAHLKHYSDIRGETPEARLADLAGEDSVDSAISGLRESLRRSDLPTLDSIASVAIPTLVFHG